MWNGFENITTCWWKKQDKYHSLVITSDSTVEVSRLWNKSCVKGKNLKRRVKDTRNLDAYECVLKYVCPNPLSESRNDKWAGRLVSCSYFIKALTCNLCVLSAFRRTNWRLNNSKEWSQLSYEVRLSMGSSRNFTDISNHCF